MTTNYYTDIATGTAIKVYEDGTYEGQSMRWKYTKTGEYVGRVVYKFTTAKTWYEKRMIEAMIDDAFYEQRNKMMDILLPGY